MKNNLQKLRLLLSEVGWKYLVMGVFLIIATSTFSQRTVTGKVADANDGFGIPGATVTIKGTTTGTITDFDGNFSIQANENDVLVVSFVGYESQEITVGSQSVINVDLGVDIQELEEIVVIGYGQVERGDVTGVVSKIDTRTFNRGVVTSPDRLIAGKVAGVQITPTGGEPGGQVNIRIRGGTSLNASNEPLFVIDGIPLDNTSHNPGGMTGGRNPLNFINPSDIADITVLKDASAAAIYGSRGANGVIIITTKQGQAGKLQLTYDGNYTITSFDNTNDFLNTEEFIFTVGRRGPKFIESLGDSDTDWVDEVTQVAQGQNHNISASFGGSSNTFRVSVNYQNLDGVLKTSNTERIAASINATQKLLNDDLTIQFNSKHSLTNDRFAPNQIGTALTFDPTQSVFSDDSTTGFYYEHSAELAADNPVSQIDQTFGLGRTARNLISANLNYNLPFAEGLSLKMNYSYDRTDGVRQRWQPGTLQSAINFEGSFLYEDFNRDSELFESYLNYTKDLSGVGLKVDLTAGYSYQDFFKEFPRFEKIDSIPVTRYEINDPEEIITDSKLNSLKPILFQPIFDQFENRLISFWGRANLHFKDRYLLTATLRRDGSTRFGEDNRWGLFPSLAAGWRILDEPFASPLTSVFTDLKARVSWGITGSQEIGDYLYVNLYEPGGERAQYIFGNDTINTIRPNAVDPGIKWEETSSINFGLDYGILGGRIYGSFEYYEKKTSDLLFEINFPAGTLTGDEAVTNIGEMNNKGFEMVINGTAIDQPDLSLDLTFNAAYNKNEIIKLDNSNAPDFLGYPVGGISGQGLDQRIQILRVGHPAYSFFVREHIRDANGNPLPDGTDHNGDGLTDDLDIYVDQLTVDTDGDGVPDAADGIINEADLVIKDKPWPDWTLGFTSNARYKNFDLAMTFRSQLGGYVYNNVSSQNGAYIGVNGAFAPNNIHRSAYTNDFREYQVLSDVYLEDGSFLRLDNITLGYSFGPLEKIRARAYLTVSNVFVISGYSGVDPEVGPSTGASDRNAFGIDNNLYPRGRTFLLGLNVTFN